MSSQPYEKLQRALVRVVRRVSIPRFHDQVIRRAGIDLDRVEAIALSRIVDGGPMRLSDLAEQMGVACSTAGRHAAHLADRGLVTRSVDPDDARAVVAAGTERGEAFVADLRRAYRELLEEMLGTWSEEEIDLAASLLGRLADGLTVSSVEAPPAAVGPRGRRA